MVRKKPPHLGTQLMAPPWDSSDFGYGPKNAEDVSREALWERFVGPLGLFFGTFYFMEAFW